MIPLQIYCDFLEDKGVDTRLLRTQEPEGVIITSLGNFCDSDSYPDGDGSYNHGFGWGFGHGWSCGNSYGNGYGGLGWCWGEGEGSGAGWHYERR